MGGRCIDCQRMTKLIVRLYAEGVLSEGQAAKATGLGRAALRERADAARNRKQQPRMIEIPILAKTGLNRISD